MLNRLEMMRIFCVAAECPSFKDAAVRLGVSPQAVTRAIKELENTIGEPLFYRNTRHMRITDFGEQLSLRAKGSIAEIDELFRPNG
ncbi:MAG: LysR family transcriptional regulator, partial [Betaproteobacteria bacterium HGW-Betaproteobacteria-2]